VVSGAPADVAKYVTETCAKYPRVISVSIQERATCEHVDTNTVVYFVVETSTSEELMQAAAATAAATVTKNLLPMTCVFCNGTKGGFGNENAVRPSRV
jgi:hypothetical protein